MVTTTHPANINTSRSTSQTCTSHVPRRKNGNVCAERVALHKPTMLTNLCRERRICSALGQLLSQAVALASNAAGLVLLPPSNPQVKAPYSLATSCYHWAAFWLSNHCTFLISTKPSVTLPAPSFSLIRCCKAKLLGYFSPLTATLLFGTGLLVFTSDRNCASWGMPGFHILGSVSWGTISSLVARLRRVSRNKGVCSGPWARGGSTAAPPVNVEVAPAMSLHPPSIEWQETAKLQKAISWAIWMDVHITHVTYDSNHRMTICTIFQFSRCVRFIQKAPSTTANVWSNTVRIESRHTSVTNYR